MQKTILGSLADGEVRESYLMTTVTDCCVIVKSPGVGSETLIALDRLSEIRVIRASYPGLLVIASGFAAIAAAAFCSKEGDGAGIPTAFLGACFVVAYAMTRRAAIEFVVDSETTQTAFGAPSQARKLREAVRTPRERTPGETEMLAQSQEVRVKRNLFGFLRLRTQRADS